MRRTPILADPRLPHQIRLWFISGEIAVGCNCDPYPLDLRSRWDDPGEPMRIWRAHMADPGVDVPLKIGRG